MQVETNKDIFAGQTNQDYYRPDWAKSNELLEYSQEK